jgi:hypothetical protein
MVRFGTDAIISLWSGPVRFGKALSGVIGFAGVWFGRDALIQIGVRRGETW